MKRFLKYFLAYLGLFLLLAIVADLWITKGLHKSTTRMLTAWNDIYFSELNNDIVIIGSSRAWVQYDPKIIDSICHVNSYNLGIDGRTIDAEVVRYNAFVRKHGYPKNVILNLDIWSMDCSNGYEREQFTPYFSDKELFNEVKYIDGFSWADKYIPCWRYSGYFDLIKEGLGLPNKMTKMNLYKGFCGQNEHFDSHNINELDSIHFNVDSTAFHIYEQFLDDCNKRDIQVIMVFAPVYIKFVERFDNFEESYTTYTGLAKRFGSPLLDYTYDNLSFDTTYFYNATHLNKDGATIFSQKLALQIDSLNCFK